MYWKPTDNFFLQNSGQNYGSLIPKGGRTKIVMVILRLKMVPAVIEFEEGREGVGGALMARPLKNHFFASSHTLRSSSA